MAASRPPGTVAQSAVATWHAAIGVGALVGVAVGRGVPVGGGVAVGARVGAGSGVGDRYSSGVAVAVGAGGGAPAQSRTTDSVLPVLCATNTVSPRIARSVGSAARGSDPTLPIVRTSSI